MTVRGKCEVHALHFVCPEGVPLTAKEQQALIDNSTFQQRLDAVIRGLEHGPLILNDEFIEAARWINEGRLDGFDKGELLS